MQLAVDGLRGRGVAELLDQLELAALLLQRAVQLALALGGAVGSLMLGLLATLQLVARVLEVGDPLLQLLQ